MMLRLFAVLLAGLALTSAALAPRALADGDSALAAARAVPGALDVRLDDRGNMFVVVKNDKVNWNQYAIYMCGVVRPHQARIFKTHVIDMTSVGRGAKPSTWKELAQADCGK